MRLLALALLLLGCEKPCALLCSSDGDCGPGAYCLNQSACLLDCLRCNGACVESVTNCSGCGVACPTGQKCSRGRCADACASDLTDCAGSCYDLKTDRYHCGRCDAPPCAHDENCVQGVCTKVDVCG